MRTYHVEARAMSTASPSEVYALLIDRPTWPSWSPIDTFELERPGHPDRQGLGSIGILRTDKHAMHEQIVELVTDRRMSYVLLSGLALRNYRANVDLEPSDGGTAIHWASSFNPKVPGMGRAYQKALTKAIKRLHDRPGHSRRSIRSPPMIDGKFVFNAVSARQFGISRETVYQYLRSAS